MRRWLSRAPAIAGLLFLWLLAACIVWLLGGNPGYFSHDELQWAVYAEQPTPPIAADWFAIGQFQYRPLTFHLWMLLSRLLFDTPRLFHVAWLLWGAGNAVLLHHVLRRFSLPTMIAATASLLFWVNPYAVYVHAWVGTLGDLLWVTAALLIALIVQRISKEDGLPGPQLAVIALLTLAALLAKEAALSIPSLLFVAWLFSGQRRWRDAFLAAAAVGGAYLLLRFGVLTDSAREGSGYGIDLAGVPLRFVDYQSFPFFPWAEEINVMSVFSYERRRNMAILALLIWLVALRGPRSWTAWLLLSFAALGPALLIGSISNQYGYGFSAALIGLGAWCWQGAGILRRIVMVFGATIFCWHAIGVARQMREVGDLQAVYSSSLAATVDAARATGRKPLGLRADCDNQRWVYQRLSNGIPSYDGVAIGSRVRVLAPEDAGSGMIETRIDCEGRVYLPD